MYHISIYLSMSHSCWPLEQHWLMALDTQIFRSSLSSAVLTSCCQSRPIQSLMLYIHVLIGCPLFLEPSVPPILKFDILWGHQENVFRMSPHEIEHYICFEIVIYVCFTMNFVLESRLWIIVVLFFKCVSVWIATANSLLYTGLVRL